VKRSGREDKPREIGAWRLIEGKEKQFVRALPLIDCWLVLLRNIKPANRLHVVSSAFSWFQL
jgi:hypothetical protein